jgi:sugar/nucleoside kinase (ribokinase family)
VNLDEIIELLCAVDLFLPSHQDVLALFPKAEPLEALRSLRSLAPHVALIAVKCGAKGVIAHAAGASEWVHIPAVPVELVDATGAGDSFCGGVLAGYAKDNDPIAALLSGVVSASFCVERLGLAGLIEATEEQARVRLTTLRDRVELQPM